MRLPYKTGRVTLTSRYGWRTLNGARNWHSGVDLCGTDKTLTAPCDGVVGVSTMLDRATDKTLTWQWGNYVRIDTPDGLKIYMCHMAKRLVKAGDTVRAGDIVGIEGNTGYSFGTHCHFEIRKNGTAVDPTPYLGIPNGYGVHDVTPAETAYADEYEHDGLKFVRAKNFRIVYHDSGKRNGTASRYINGGFFAKFRKSGASSIFTLPVANLVCDISGYSDGAEKYLSPFVVGGKLYYSCNHNQTKQFSGKKVSTLVVPYSGKPYVDDLNEPPKCKFAISGVPTVRNGDDVDYYNYVRAQGWDDSCMRPTYRNWLGVRNGEIYVISGKTKDKNYIYGMEIWKKLKSENFEDVICLDGGSSYFRKCGGIEGWLNDTVNNLVEF